MDRSTGVLRWYLLSDKTVPLGDMLHYATCYELMKIDLYKIADLMWKNMTVQEACKELGYDWREVDRLLDTEKRGYLLDVSMVAGARDEYLGER